jgi:hypothetical protein
VYRISNSKLLKFAQVARCDVTGEARALIKVNNDPEVDRKYLEIDPKINKSGKTQYRTHVL